MIVVALIIMIAGPWMLDILSTYTITLFENLPAMVRE